MASENKPLPKAMDMPLPTRVDGAGPTVVGGKIMETPIPQEQWTLWKEANYMFTALDGVAAQIRRTRSDLERNIMEIERMLGSMPRPK